MTEARSPSPRPVRYAATFVATCLILLQLVTALHFALVPHRFGAGLRELVHSQGQSTLNAALRGPPGVSREASFRRGSAHAEPESCPLGFAGPHSLSFAAPESGALLECGAVGNIAPAARRALTRSVVLLGAPKTSPPLSRLAA